MTMNARAVVLASAVALALPLGACSPSGGFPARQAQAGADAPDPGYRAAPQVAAVTKAGDGAVSLSGRALPSSQLRMVSLTGLDTGPIRADGSGVWTAQMGPVSEPALYVLTEEVGGQKVEAEGLIAVLPGAPTVALLRAGFGAEVVRNAGKEPLKILAVDYDMAGCAVVSGAVRSASPVRVMVDGQAAVEGAAGLDGRFSLSLPKPLPPGRHVLQVMTPQATVQAVIVATPPAPSKDAPYQARQDTFGWRIDWVTPGGGAQTTLLPAG
ncbi:MAG: hypothetical protein ACXWKY_07755 [Caulobacteraceae bacterium]